jgi:carbon-monoxide dehydrogenase large subunit
MHGIQRNRRGDNAGGAVMSETLVAPSAARAIGASLQRAEDARLLTGQGEYVADVNLPGMLYVAVVRSDLAHAAIQGVDVRLARDAPGVVDAFAATDVERYMKPIPSRDPLPPSLVPLVEYPLAIDRVRYVGQPVAVVVASSRRLAEDAAAMVAIDYDPLPAVASVEAALAPEAPSLFPGVSNVAHTLEKAVGDVAAARQTAAVVVEAQFNIHRVTGLPLEPRGLVASFDPATGALSVWGATKVPYHNRRELARMLEIQVEQVHYRATDIGGGFGVRGEFYPEDLLIPLAAIRVGRPVQWIEDRSEHLMATNHSREGTWHAHAAFEADGTLVGLDAELTMDFGAYVRTLGANVPLFASFALVGPYRIPNYRCLARSVVTNKMGIGSVRSPGGYEASFVRERLLDIAAERLGIDRVELRRRNLVTADAMPYDTGVPSGDATMVYDGGDYAATLDTVLDAIGDMSLAEERRRAEPLGYRIGLGIACCNEGTGAGAFEKARIRCEPDERFTVFVATTAMGQGHCTALAQIAADALAVSPEAISVVENDSELVPAGTGTYASRSMLYAGNAVWLAASELRRQLDGGADGPHDVTREFRTELEAFPHAVSAAVVEVDPELGQVRILRYIVAAEVGNVINPMLVHGQLAGAAVLGLGGALLEELRYASDGTLLAAGLMDYLVPTALDIPLVETHVMPPDPADNPLGVRGAGEIGTTGAAAALANAVADALGDAAAITSLPLSPDSVRDAASKLLDSAKLLRGSHSDVSRD